MVGPLPQAAAGSRRDDGSSEASIVARSVSKSFRLPHERYTTAKQRLLRPLAHRRYDVLDALDDVSFEVRGGECFGIVGRNGSGKSTLLKCISRIYRVDEGEIEVSGRLAPFIELGVGFNPELTARDNVVINAVLLGLTPTQARERFDEIVAFAELEPFVDMKLKNFSTGMSLRLAFAVTTQVDAEVLLFDEVIAVGDASFEAKCLSYLDRLRSQGRTVVLVTHDMRAVEHHCDRGMLLDRGRVSMIGDADELARAYEEANRGEKGAVAAHADEAPLRRHTLPQRSGLSLKNLAALRIQVPRVLAITKTLAVAEFKLKYFDAWLSYLWILVRPLAFFGTLYFVFTEIGRFDRGVGHYPIYLLSSLVLWFYFADSTAQAVYALVAKEPLLRRVPFPHVAIPLSVVAIGLFDLGMSALAVLVFMLATGVEPRLTWLELIPIMILYTTLVAGAAMLLSALYVRFRDIDHIWGLARQILFYASPIFYVTASFPAAVRPFLEANPLDAAFTQLRHALIDAKAPSFVTADGGWARALVPVGLVFVIFFLGLWVFNRESPTVPENV
jgi:ABC-type polysaccharide/polyol phosphate transport system ATPase subunit/ABC-type polysaccharide/polyol phosphate export permease